MESSLPSQNKAPPKAASLLGLAVEIRSEILKHLFGGVIVHVSSNRTRRPAKTVDAWFPTYRYFVCCDINPDRSILRSKAMGRCRSSWSGYACEYKNFEFDWDSLSRERDDRKARRHLHMAIARSNRQMYKETHWAFFEYNTFSFCEPVAWQQFLEKHKAELNHLRSIELFTMTPWYHPERAYGERGYGEGDPYAIMPDDHRWKFDNIGMLRNVTKIVLGLRDPYHRYPKESSHIIVRIGQALDTAFGDLSGLKRLKDAQVFLIPDSLRMFVGVGQIDPITYRLSDLASDLEAKLLAFNPHNIAQSMHEEETQRRA